MTTEVMTAPATTPAATPETTRPRRVWRPLTDIVETRDGIVLTVEMPGVRSEDVDVSLEKRVLTIRGRVSPGEPEKLRRVHVEYEPGDYERTFTLSEDIDAEGIDARMKNGVLTLHLPRAAAAQPRQIQVKSA